MPTNKMILPLRHLLPIRVLMVIASHPVQSTMMGTWKSFFSGQFTIKTIYK